MAFSVNPLAFISAMITGAFAGFNFLTYFFIDNSSFSKTLSLIAGTLLLIAFLIGLVKSVDKN